MISLAEYLSSLRTFRRRLKKMPNRCERALWLWVLTPIELVAVATVLAAWELAEAVRRLR